ncbi:MAG: GNAT family N-acetyltransferase, partial [Solirubrobacteraceae bacterium]
GRIAQCWTAASDQCIAQAMSAGFQLVHIRPYGDDDEPGVLGLLQAAFGTWPRLVEDQDPGAAFRWKHLANPAGRSVMMVAETNGTLVGFAAWMQWKVTAGATVFEVLRAVDVAVDRRYRGQGVYAGLVREATVRFVPEVAFTFNAPNELSRRGSLTAGGRELDVFALLVRPRAPLRSAVTLVGHGTRSGLLRGSPAIEAESAANALSHREQVATLLAQIEHADGRLATVRDLDYLTWRYGTLPVYRAVREYQDGRLAGMAFFRVRRRQRSWISIVCDLLVRPGDRSTARRLLRAVAQAAPVDYLVCHFPEDSAARRAAIQRGFVRLRSGPAPVVRQLVEHIEPDPTSRSSWAISLGDLDLL